MPLQEINAELGLPWGLGKIGGTWCPDAAERAAAWEMLVELSTRVTLVELRPGEGLLREALTSYYSLFAITRDILRRHGPGTAQAGQDRGGVSFAALAISVLNGGIRPLLGYWHPTLADYEEQRPPAISSIEWERSWDRADQLRGELSSLRELLAAYAGIIADVCDARAILGAIAFQPIDAPGGQSR
jgi:hypothetical protein